jgi:hypothetical protein
MVNDGQLKIDREKEGDDAKERPNQRFYRLRQMGNGGKRRAGRKGGKRRAGKKWRETEGGKEMARNGGREMARLNSNPKLVYGIKPNTT